MTAGSNCSGPRRKSPTIAASLPIERGRAHRHAEVFELRVVVKRDCARRRDGAAAPRHRHSLSADLVRAGASERTPGFRRRC